MTKVGRNDPCPCGSGKKYKSCCFAKEQPGAKRKFSAKVISAGRKVAPNLFERTYGDAIASEGAPPRVENQTLQEDTKND